MSIQLFEGDCLEVMPTLAAGSVVIVLCDLPYGITSNARDSVIPLPALWAAYARVCRGRIVLCCAQPFTSALVMSNITAFRYTWTWVKTRPTGFQNAKKMPMRITEDIAIFGAGAYNPQGLLRIHKVCKNSKSAGGGNVRDDIALSANRGSLRTAGAAYVQEFTNYPWNILECGLDEATKIKIHPTQKPVALMEYLIKTYTDPGDTVLDNCMGGGTTGVACVNTGRSFIGIEKDPTYFQIAKERIEKTQKMEPQPVLFSQE